LRIADSDWRDYGLWDGGRTNRGGASITSGFRNPQSDDPQSEHVELSGERWSASGELTGGSRAGQRQIGNGELMGGGGRSDKAGRGDDGLHRLEPVADDAVRRFGTRLPRRADAMRALVVRNRLERADIVPAFVKQRGDRHRYAARNDEQREERDAASVAKGAKH
jgi:hypothetical protein